MTNEEKAKEIADNAKKQQYFDSRCNDLAGNVGFMSAIQMAEWKDQQFGEYLEKKKRYYKNKAEEMDYYDMPTKEERETYKSISYVIDEIINELFKKE